jgi:protease IV
MKQFFKFMFASMLGFIISGTVLILIFVAVLVGSLSSAFESQGKKTTAIKDNSILHLTLTQEITDRHKENDFSFNFGSFQDRGKIGLDKTIEFIKKAKDDEKIKGIYLDLSQMSMGSASLEDIRDALVDFKTSGKWIISYSETYGTGSYYLASVADEIYIYPEGDMSFLGLSAEIMFLKGMLEKLDIEPQILRGPDNKYKSAVEPLLYDKMSDSNREQMDAILASLWGRMLSDISASRNISVDSLNSIANKAMVQRPADAVKVGLATKTIYKDEMLEMLRAKVEADDIENIEFVTLPKYFRTPELKKADDLKKALATKDKVAVVYAIGGIGGGEGSDDEIGSERISQAIRDARLDTTVKAIVLRVNSPGGSALASDVIWRETILAKQAKPFIVSMGDVAASGGYYIACAADKIYASPNTITGSIGVFGVIPNMQKFFNNKLGITFDVVKTNEYADMMTVSRPLKETERAMIEDMIIDIYDDFIGKVAEGRKMSPDQVDEVARGRVWTGTDALELGLIDELGGLDAAIAYAAEMANLEDYKTVGYPEMKDPFEEIMKELKGETKAWAAEMFFGEDVRWMKHYQQIEMVRKMEGIQMRMPYSIEIR